MLKFLVITIAILWLVRLIVRLVFPWAMRKMAQKVMNDAQRPYGNGPYRNASAQQQGQEQRTADGKIRIDYMPPQPKAKRGAQTAGEFVDFEEIKSSAK